MEIPFFTTTNGITDKYLLKHHPDYYELIFDFVKEIDISISERIWLYQNRLTEIPKCINCNNKVSFIKFYKGYRKYCSRKCSVKHTNMNESIKEKRIEKMLLCNYDKDIREQMTLKANKTKSEFSTDKKDEINNKRSISVLEKYGVGIVSQNSDVKEKISTKLRDVLPKVVIKKSIDRVESLGFKYINGDKHTLTLICPKCVDEFSIKRTLFTQRTRFNITQCLLCNPNNNDSDFERSIYEFILDNYDGEVISKFKKFKKYEIDIYLPELKIGIECNGLWWHSEVYKEREYHIEKTNFFKENDIHIIHIWEDDWKYKSEIVKSRLLNLIGKTQNRIFARKCKIKELDKTTYDMFCNDNHIQGTCMTSVKIGLYHNDDLVSVMGIGKLRKNVGMSHVEDNWELLRFCSLRNTVVIGSMSKLLSSFVKEYNPIKIISYADRSWSVGNSYLTNGFTFVRNTVPNYHYFNKDTQLRENRFKYRKDRLVSEGYDKNKTEIEIMKDRGYYRIFDVGSILLEINYDYNK